MKITYDDKGIHIKKLFKSREIPYSDIRSVVLSNGEYTFTTKAGEVIVGKYRIFDNRAPLYDAFKNYNIHFRDEDELKETDKVYSIEEVREKIAQTQTVIREYANKLLHDKFGSEYDIDMKMIDEGELVNVYFSLLKNGALVEDIPEAAKYDSDGVDPYSFDNYVLAFLVEWDGNGRYSVTEEVEKPEFWGQYLKQPLKQLFEYMKREG